MNDRKYTESHEWAKVEGDIATIGISDYAQNELGDIVYVECPGSGETFSKGDSLGLIESVKASTEFYAPVSGEITEVNEALADNPELVNESPFEKGWLLKIQMSDTSELDSMLSAEAYKEKIS